MPLSSLVGTSRARRQPPPRRRAGHRLAVEALEDRAVPSAALVRDIDPGAPSSQPADLIDVGGTVFFLASDPDHGRELWRSDGTAAGTARVVDLTPGPADTNARLLAAVDGRLFFAVYPPPRPSGGGGGDKILGGGERVPGGVIELETYSVSLWVTDGTEAGTVRLTTFGAFGGGTVGVGAPTVADGTLYFLTSQGSAPDPLGLPGIVSTTGLWRTDGTAAGTRLVATAGEFAGIAAAGGTLFASAYVRPDVGFELYRLNPSGIGLQLVRDIRPGSANSFPRRLTDLNGTLVFEAGGAAAGELWRSDGTEEGTFVVRDIRPGALPSGPANLTVVGNTLYFTADDGEAGRELWRTDGTEEGTYRVRDLRPGPAGSEPSQLTAVGGALFFTANDGKGGRELWRTDGTEEGTYQVRDLRPGPGSSVLGNLTAVGDTLFLTFDDGENGRELWASDGTADGTRLVRDVRPGSAGSDPQELRAVGGRLFFSADDGVTGRELWVVAPAAVEAVAVNDGSAQRSRVTGLTVTFSGAVALEDGAFELRRSDGSPVELSVTASVVKGRTVAVLTFVGDDVVGGSLADGDYTLTVRGDLVRDELGRALDGDGDGTPGGDRVAEFFRLYGDADGNRTVDGADRDLFDSTFGLGAKDPGFLGYFDYDGDGLIGDVDLAEFLARRVD